MSQMDVEQVKANFEIYRLERGAGLSPSRAFERYVFEQVLKNFDPADEDLDVGDFGKDKEGEQLKGDDGGVDGMYLYINDILIGEETEVPPGASDVELHLIQAKSETSFKETAIEKLESFARDLFEYSRPVESTSYLNSKVKDSIANFRTKYRSVFGRPHKFRIVIHYVSLAESVPSPKEKVMMRAGNLERYIKGINTAAQVTFIPWAAPEMWESVLTFQEDNVSLPCAGGHHFSTKDESSVCLVKVSDFARAVLSNKDGSLKTRILEPNVRDYQGKTNPVNEGIRATLSQKEYSEDFWWLNNGVTILATRCSFSGDQVSIENPEIVNGLQTSHEVFNWLTENRDTKDERLILLRILKLPDDADVSRRNIIKATNSQTKVDEISLLSTEPVQQYIEDRLRFYDLFYDRKKGRCRRLKRPIKKIVGMKDLIRSVIAIHLRKPDQATGRPETFTKNNQASVFPKDMAGDVYVACVLLDRKVQNYLASTSLPINEKRSMRCYVGMFAMSELTRKSVPMDDDIVSAIDDIQRCDDAFFSAIVEQIIEVLRSTEGDQVQFAKSENMAKMIQCIIESKYQREKSEVK